MSGGKLSSDSKRTILCTKVQKQPPKRWTLFISLNGSIAVVAECQEAICPSAKNLRCPARSVAEKKKRRPQHTPYDGALGGLVKTLAPITGAVGDVVNKLTNDLGQGPN
ncbi:hypothetical protein EV179_002230 [Coemansia sp. RSA 487]|nr:hypothetical protein EV179_002230 [Coemansia sp. RSA 487]